MSSRWKVKLPWVLSQSRFFSVFVRERSSITTREWPRRIHAATALQPMNPAPPVTTIFMSAFDDALGALVQKTFAEFGSLCRLGPSGCPPPGRLETPADFDANVRRSCDAFETR